ncbi:MAG: hypothetical protein J2P36_39370, partial [Ktedonobacteraceae bacterium]|nr:hypothetical protein [Ktedonobacteraceae bacterium]
TIIGIKNGLQVATDEDAVMPAAIPGGQLGQKSVPAHIVTSGSAGNIAALYINQECCAANNSIFVKNLAAFVGGQDAKDYRFVRQGDVDAYVKANRGTVEQAANEQLKQQIEARHLTAGSPGIRCTTTASGADGQVGDQGRDIPSVSITLNATCSALAYNQSDLDRLLTAHLNARAARDHGPAYRLVGAVSSRVDSQQASPAGKPAPLTLTTSARGFYVYQFDSASKQRLTRLIAGKSRAVAQSLLAQQPGIASASIAVDPLPADPARVSIVIKVPPPSA